MVIQSYAAASNCDDEEVEIFYKNISRAIEVNRTQYRLLIEGLNAKLLNRKYYETFIANFSYDQRNQLRGLGNCQLNKRVSRYKAHHFE